MRTSIRQQAGKAKARLVERARKTRVFGAKKFVPEDVAVSGALQEHRYDVHRGRDEELAEIAGMPAAREIDRRPRKAFMWRNRRQRSLADGADGARAK